MQLKKFLLFGLFAAILPAVAEEAADRKTATSLKYVTHELDTRQNKFTAESNKAMEYTNTAGTVQKRTVKSDLGSDTSDTSLPMVGGVNTKLGGNQRSHCGHIYRNGRNNRTKGYLPRHWNIY